MNTGFFQGYLSDVVGSPRNCGNNVRLFRDCEQHEWIGCKCSSCGEKRDEQHDWSNNCNVCSICEKIRTDGHIFQNGYCKACGIKQPKEGFTIDERDGKKYKTIQIGSQIVMAENFAYRPKSGKYWAYDNDERNVEKQGYLYDWKTANTIAPAGWHLPTREEWEMLYDSVGGDKEGKYNAMKEGGSSFFNALFFGYYAEGKFYSAGRDANFWSSTASDPDEAWSFDLVTFNSGMYSNFRKNGFSVRLFKDQ